MASTTTAKATRSRLKPATVSAAGPADKYDERRNQLAESALQTLGELGYARASLREIAQQLRVQPRRRALLLPATSSS